MILVEKNDRVSVQYINIKEAYIITKISVIHRVLCDCVFRFGFTEIVNNTVTNQTTRF